MTRKPRRPSWPRKASPSFGLVSHTPFDQEPQFLLRPAAFLKLMFCCHGAATEIGGFGISSQEDPLILEEFVLVDQRATAFTVELDDAAVADHVEQHADQGIAPNRCARVWIHTHPGTSATPSSTDEQTFAGSFGGCDWSAMLIQSRGSERYGRLQFNAGPGCQAVVPVTFDWASLPQWLLEHAEELSSIVRGWAADLEQKVAREASSWVQTDATAAWIDELEFEAAMNTLDDRDLQDDLHLTDYGLELLARLQQEEGAA